MKPSDATRTIELVILTADDLRALVREEVAKALPRVSTDTEWLDARSTPISRTLFRRLCASGELPALKIGRSYKVRRRDLEAWIQNHRPAPRAASQDDDPVEKALAEGRLRVVPGGGGRPPKR
jgi:excisionase family DNA binding protein